jgi:hypothetical protein
MDWTRIFLAFPIDLALQGRNPLKKGAALYTQDLWKNLSKPSKTARYVKNTSH